MELRFDQTVYGQIVAGYDVALTVFVLVLLMITSGILNDTINKTVSVPLQRIFGMIMHALPGCVFVLLATLCMHDCVRSQK